MFTTQRPKPSLLAAIVELCRRERERRRRAEAATEIEIVLALDLMKDFYHANSWQQRGHGMVRAGAWLGIAGTFMVATKLDLYRHLAERLSFKPAQRKTLHIYQA